MDRDVTPAAEAADDAPADKDNQNGSNNDATNFGSLVSMRWDLRLFLGGTAASSAAAITSAIPGYVANLDSLQLRVVDALGLGNVPSVAEYSERLMDTVDLTVLLPKVLATVSGSGSAIIAAALYAVFVLADLDRLPEKTRLALVDPEQAEHMLAVVGKINRRIGKAN